MRAQRRALIQCTDRNQLLLGTHFFLICKHLTTDKIRFFEINEKTEPRLDGRPIRGEIRSVKRVANLEPKRIASAQSAGSNLKLRAELQNVLPNLCGINGREKNLESVFACVAGTGDGDADTVERVLA